MTKNECAKLWVASIISIYFISTPPVGATSKAMEDIVMNAENEVKVYHRSRGFTEQQVEALALHGFLFAQNQICGETHTSAREVIGIGEILSARNDIPYTIFISESATTAVRIMNALKNEPIAAIAFCKLKKK